MFAMVVTRQEHSTGLETESSSYWSWVPCESLHTSKPHSCGWTVHLMSLISTGCCQDRVTGGGAWHPPGLLPGPFCPHPHPQHRAT